MDLRSGTPIWLTLLLSIGAVLATHFLTTWREWKKRTREELSKWKDDCNTLLTEIVDSAIAHYSDPSSLDSTGASSLRILTLLKRFGSRMRDVACVDSSDTKGMTDAIGSMRDTITLPDDFQDKARAIRPANDLLLGQIHDCEQRLRDNIRRPRKLKV